jgi:hypothetical protein
MVTLSWSSQVRVDRDYTVFVHAVGADGSLLAQDDGQPDGGRYPTSLWDPGEMVPDSHPLTVPAGARLEVGLYDAATGQRLKLADGRDFVLLPT